MQERILSVLSHYGYTPIYLNIPGIYLYLTQYDEAVTQVIVCVDETEGNYFTREQFLHISEQIRDFLCQRNCLHSRFLYLLLTEDDSSSRRLFQQYDNYWRIVPSRGIVMAYENSDPVFSPLQHPLENLFIPQAPTDEKRYIPFITWTLIFINVLIFLITDLFSSNPDAMIDRGALSYSLVFYQQEIYRIISSMFLHIGPEHLFNNMLVLWVIGSYLEEQLGHRRFAFLYFLSGILAGCTSMVYNMLRNDLTVSVGASGAIFGVMGGLVFAIWHVHRNNRDFDLRRVLFMAALSLYGGFTSQGVDNAAHVGGFAGGFLITALLLQTLERKGRKKL